MPSWTSPHPTPPSAFTWRKLTPPKRVTRHSWPGNPPRWGTPPLMWKQSRNKERLYGEIGNPTKVGDLAYLGSPTSMWTDPNLALASAVPFVPQFPRDLDTKETMPITEVCPESVLAMVEYCISNVAYSNVSKTRRLKRIIYRTSVVCSRLLVSRDNQTRNRWQAGLGRGKGSTLPFQALLSTLRFFLLSYLPKSYM